MRDKTVDQKSATESFASLLKKHQCNITKRVKYFGLQHHISHEVDDLNQEALIHLNDCVSRYEPDRGASFETYFFGSLEYRLFDYLRRLDSIGRRDRQAIVRLNKLHDRSTELSRGDIAKEMGISFRNVERLLMLKQSSPTSLDSLDEIIGISWEELYGDDGANPEMIVGIYELIARVSYLFEKISPEYKEKMEEVFRLHFIEGESLAEVGKFFNVSEGRVCQWVSELKELLAPLLQEYER